MTPIPSKIIDTFCKGTSGYAVVIDYSSFIQRLKERHGKYACVCDQVKYKFLTAQQEGDLLKNSPETRLFYKEPSFSYQKEFRILFYCSLPFANNGKYNRFGTLYSKEYEPMTLNIGDIRSFSKKYFIADLDQDSNGDFLLPIKR